jgi:hypothetical protein
MVKTRKNDRAIKGHTYYTKTFTCLCGYQFNNKSCRLVDKIEKLHISRCTIGKNAITQYRDINIDYTASKKVQTTTSILHNK